MKLILFLTSFFFLYSCENSPCGNIGFKSVCVTIENKSGTEIKFVELVYDHGGETVQMLENGKSAHISFESNGENSYRLNVGFITGKKLSTEVYTENGYAIKHIVRGDEIETKY